MLFILNTYFINVVVIIQIVLIKIIILQFLYALLELNHKTEFGLSEFNLESTFWIARD